MNEQLSASAAWFVAAQQRSARVWAETMQTAFGKLKACDALWARYTVTPDHNTAERLDWLKGVIGLHLRDADPQAVLNDPHLVQMVGYFWPRGGVQRLKDRAAAQV